VSVGRSQLALSTREDTRGYTHAKRGGGRGKGERDERNKRGTMGTFRLHSARGERRREAASPRVFWPGKCPREGWKERGGTARNRMTRILTSDASEMLKAVMTLRLLLLRSKISPVQVQCALKICDAIARNIRGCESRICKCAKKGRTAARPARKRRSISTFAFAMM